MAICECRCDADIAARTIESYDTTMFGINMILIKSVIEETCEACGEKTITIPDQEGLIAAAALTRIKAPLKLRGNEIKFVRKALSISARDFAKLMGVNGETLSRWEHDKQPITPSNEKLLRLLACINLETKAPAIEISQEDIAQMSFIPISSGNDESVMVFERVKIKIKTIFETYSETDSKAA